MTATDRHGWVDILFVRQIQNDVNSIRLGGDLGNGTANEIQSNSAKTFQIVLCAIRVKI